MTETAAQLRLSIWRDFTPTRPLIGLTQHQTSEEVIELRSGLQEEVYSWHTSEGPFDGIVDEEVRRDLIEALFVNLHASRSPSDRSLAVLDSFINKAERAIDLQQDDWAASQGPFPSDIHSANRLKPLLALTLHLKWISRCFADRPGISVSVR